jgi:hypothetical protein
MIHFLENYSLYMRLIIILISVFIYNLGLGQSISRFKTSLDFTYQTKVLNTSSFSKDLKVITSVQLKQPLNYVGFTLFSDIVVNNKSSYEGGYHTRGFIEYLKIIPQQIRVQDTLVGIVKGFNIGITLLT